MKTRFANLCQVMALTLLACFCLSAFAFAADNTVKPRFVVIPQKQLAPGVKQPAGTLQTWNGSFTYNGTNYPFVMVGQDPSTGLATEITTYMIPVKIILSNGHTYDPLSGGPHSPLAMTLLSPIFDSTTTYTQGGVDVGTTQYEDAFQRGNFWSTVQNQPGYHVLLGGPTARVSVLPELTLNVPAEYGTEGSPFGQTVAEVDINYFDAQISNYMANNNTINPSNMPMFIVANTYLTEGGCCIGGYHSANGQQTYGMFDYDTQPGVFSQDVSALSHEFGEWVDDPLTNGGNNTPCGILEVGDPLEGGSNGHPYGTWEYPLHGFTYHLQDLTFLRYFGGPVDGSVNDWWTFQNFPYTRICQQGS
jgi:hypothetical protein